MNQESKPDTEKAASLDRKRNPWILVRHKAAQFAFTLIAILLVFSHPAAASTYLDIKDDAYPLLARLEAEGVIKSGLLTMKPVSRKEAVRLLREAEENSKDRNEFIKSLVRELRDRIRPETVGPESFQFLDTAYATYIQNTGNVQTLTYGGAKEKQQAFNANNDGDLYSLEGNGRIGFTSRIEDISRFSFFLNPEFRSAHDDGSLLILRNGYAVFDFGWDLIIGKDSQWWGPGYRGALLLSNNAESLTVAKIANPSPFIPPWIFKFMGPTDFSFFITRLEHDRPDVPSPYLWGMRLNFKPHPIIEIGLERTALLGGEGRPTDAHTWIDSILGTGEHGANEAGDQRAGYDVKLNLPFEIQPAQVYLEAVAEDNVHTVPSQWGYLYGIYLPRILSLDRLEFRVEWARTDDGNSSRPSTFYLHHIYTAGYTYNGLIIGHFIGTDSRNIYSELSYRIPERHARVSLSFDRAEHGVSQSIQETDQQIALEGKIGLTQSIDLELLLGSALTHNAEFVPGADQRSTIASGTITKRF